MEQIRVLLADDHPGFLAGVRSALEREQDIIIIGEVVSGKAALEKTRVLLPDVLLLDMELPDMSGVDVAERIKELDLPTLVLPLSGFSDPEYVFGVLESGAAGYMTKDESLKEIVHAIRKVASGGVHVSPKVAIAIVNEKMRREGRATTKERQEEELRKMGITPALREVLYYVAKGHNNRQIGMALCRSEHTIRNHVTQLRSIVGVHRRPELVAWAWQHGFVGEERLMPDG